MRTIDASLSAVILILVLVMVPEASPTINCDCERQSSVINRIDITCAHGPSGSPLCRKAFRSVIPSGYRYIPRLGLFKLHTLSKSYEAAQKTCEKEGGRLAIPQNEAMAAALTTLFTPESKVTYAYIGINDLGSTGFYQGSDEELAPWLNWNKDEPNHSGGIEHCVQFDKNKGMSDVNCLGPVPFICERKLKTPLPKGYQFIERQGFYKAYKEQKSFKEAEAKCQEDGAHLAVPETLSEAVALNQLVRTVENLGNVWIGISDQATEGKFVTVHGTPMEDLEFNNWTENEPSAATEDEDCVKFLYAGSLNDQPCSNKFSFVCELVMD